MDELIFVIVNNNIQPQLLKEIVPAIIHLFLHVINLSFTMDIVPNILKVAWVIPDYKKGDQSLLYNYRPIFHIS